MGEDSLRDMCHVRHMSVDRVALGSTDPLWFPYTERSYQWFRKGMRALFSSGSLVRRIGSLF
jgi:succinate-semialdehyde dehydrogenase/glutarate-semialdehyde dehydrogenase